MSICPTTDNHRKRHLNIVKLNSGSKVYCSINNKPSCGQKHSKQHYKDYGLCNQWYIQTESINLDSNEAETMDAAHNQLCSDEYEMECHDAQQTGDVVVVLPAESDRLVALHETFLKYFQHTIDIEAKYLFLCVWIFVVG